MKRTAITTYQPPADCLRIIERDRRVEERERRREASLSPASLSGWTRDKLLRRRRRLRSVVKPLRDWARRARRYRPDWERLPSHVAATLAAAEKELRLIGEALRKS